MPKTRTNDKLRIFDLFRRGIKIKDIAQTCNVSSKTLYRWWDEWKNNYSDQPHKEEDTKPLEAKIEAIQKASVSESKLELELEKINWIDFANKQSLEACIANGLIRKNLSEILLEEINKQDINYRALSILSNCINVHSKLEREYGLYDTVLNPDKAMTLLTSMGYSVREEE